MRMSLAVMITALRALLSPSAAVAETLFVTSPDGTRIAYDVAGTGPALMLLHGGGQTRHVWREHEYVARLSKDFTVITIDMRGNGESDKPSDASAYAIDALSADLLAVADAAGARTFGVWGFSYGANVGRYLASRSDRVTAMVYVGIPFGAAAEGAFRDQILRRDIGWLTAMLTYPAVEPSDMMCPTLWLVGTANTGAIESVKRYAGRLAGTRVELRVLDGLNHPEEISRIDDVLPLAEAFLKRAR